SVDPGRNRLCFVAQLEPAGPDSLQRPLSACGGHVVTATRSAIPKSLRWITICGREHLHSCRLASPQAKAKVADTDFQRIAQGSPCDKLHFLAIGQAHLQEAMNDCIVARNPDDPSPLTHADLIQRCHWQSGLGRKEPSSLRP